MTGGKRSALAALAASAAALCWPGIASATTVTMGDPAAFTGNGVMGCLICVGRTYAQGFSPDADINFAPAAGLITSWRVEGEGKLELRALESAPEGGWVSIGTSAPANNVEGQPNAAHLPIGSSDLIAVDLPASATKALIGFENVLFAEVLEWAPDLVDGGAPEEPLRQGEERLKLSAEEVLAPVLSAVSPASGSTTGGNAVTISGKYLDGATSVTLGSTPASSFSVDPSGQILTAIAPPSAAATVDVRVTGPGGSSEVSPADRYTFTAPATTTSTAPATTLVGSSPLGGVIATPAASGFSESASRWRRGSALPHISSAGKPPLGTTFSFTLNEPATVSFSFTQRVPGRQVKGRCVAVGQRNAGKPKCKRTVSVGSLGLAGHAGLDKVRFEGRLSSAKTLKPGSYTVTITARDSHGLASLPHSLSFTIIPG